VGLFRVMSYCAAPPVVALAVFADEAVLVLLGAEWTEAAEPFRWLSLACAAQIVTLQAGNMFIAQGCGRLFLQFCAANALIVTAAFAAGLPWGITGVAFCYATACVGVCTPLLVCMLARTPRLELGPIARATLPGILLAATLCAALPLLREMLEPSAGAIGAAAAAAGALVASYAVVLGWTVDGRAAIRESRQALARLRRRTPADPAGAQG
jgi:PST family polysaccharide transporter